jgi:hypothetical protein
MEVSGQFDAPAALPPGITEGKVGPRVGLDAVEKSLSLYRLRYPEEYN